MYKINPASFAGFILQDPGVLLIRVVHFLGFAGVESTITTISE